MASAIFHRCLDSGLMAMAMNDPFLLPNSDFALSHPLQHVHAGYEEEKGGRERDSPQVDRLPLKGLSDGRTDGEKKRKKGEGRELRFLGRRVAHSDR